MNHFRKDKPNIFLDHIEDIISLEGTPIINKHRPELKRFHIDKCVKYPFHKRQIVSDNRGRVVVGGAKHISSNGKTIVQAMLGTDDPYSDSNKRRPKHSNLLTPAEKTFIINESAHQQPYIKQLMHFYGCLDGLICEIFDKHTYYNPSFLASNTVTYRPRTLELYFEIEGHFSHIQGAIRRAATRKFGCIASQWRDPKDRALDSIEDKWLLKTDCFNSVSEAILKVYPKGENKQVTRVEIQLKFKNLFDYAYCNPIIDPKRIDRSLTLANASKRLLIDNLNEAERILTTFHNSINNMEELSGDFISAFLNFSRRLFKGVDSSKKHEAIAKSIYEHGGTTTQLLGGLKCNNVLRNYERIGVLVRTNEWQRGSTISYSLAPDWKVKFRTALKLRNLRKAAISVAANAKPIRSDWRSLFATRRSILTKTTPAPLLSVFPINSSGSKLLIVDPKSQNSFTVSFDDNRGITVAKIPFKIA